VVIDENRIDRAEDGPAQLISEHPLAETRVSWRSRVVLDPGFFLSITSHQSPITILEYKNRTAHMGVSTPIGIWGQSSAHISMCAFSFWVHPVQGCGPSHQQCRIAWMGAADPNPMVRGTAFEYLAKLAVFSVPNASQATRLKGWRISPFVLDQTITEHIMFVAY
jgi:hypothetical protein